MPLPVELFAGLIRSSIFVQPPTMFQYSESVLLTRYFDNFETCDAITKVEVLDKRLCVSYHPDKTSKSVYVVWPEYLARGTNG